jgi:hypothetical protein
MSGNVEDAQALSLRFAGLRLERTRDRFGDIAADERFVE